MTIKTKLINVWNRFKMTNFYTTHRQELIVIPILIIGFAVINFIFGLIWPDNQNFYVSSQLETLFYYSLKIVSVITIAWFAFRVSLPPFYKLFHRFYHGEDNLDDKLRIILSVILFCVFILSGAIISRGAGRGDSIRIEMKKLLDSQLYIREVGNNRGPEVDIFNRAVGAPLGSYWCAAYVSYDLNYFHIQNPNSAWSPNFAKPKDIIWTQHKRDIKLKYADVFTEYYASLKRVGHVGFYLFTDPENFFVTQAGNTSGPGSRNGDRVGRHKISPDYIYAISRYIK